MELFIIVALLCLGIAAQPFAAKRLSPLVQGTLGSLCVGVSLAIVSLVASGLVTLPGLANGQQAQADDSTAEKPAITVEAEDSEPATKSSAVKSEAEPVDGLKLETEESVIIPPGRPQWVEAAPVREGAIHFTSISSDPYATPSLAQHALDEKLQAAVADYIREYLQSDIAPSLIRIGLPEIKRELLRSGDVYPEKIQVSIGPMHQVHARLEFDDAFRARLDKRWGELRATYRLAETGIVSGGVLLLLATVFGYFRLDNATRGYYTGRLQFMAAAAILTIVVGGAMFSRWIHWL
jgi:hypothetical protein